MNPARNLLKIAGGFVFGLVVCVLGFLIAATIGAAIPRSATSTAEFKSSSPRSGQPVTIYLLSGLLHTDIVLPANERVLAAFPGLNESTIPFDHPELTNLSFGWGSHAFYTTAGEYTDIRVSTAWRAATGDKSVMRVVGLPDLSEGENIRAFRLAPSSFDALLAAIQKSFRTNDDGGAIYLPGYSLGGADAFYAGEGHFNLLNPCNQWTANVLSEAGIATGRWTPTTYALLWSLDWHN